MSLWKCKYRRTTGHRRHLHDRPKSKTLTVLSADEDVGRRRSQSLLVGGARSAATWEESLAVSYKTKHLLTI